MLFDKSFIEARRNTRAHLLTSKVIVDRFMLESMGVDEFANYTKSAMIKNLAAHIVSKNKISLERISVEPKSAFDPAYFEDYYEGRVYVFTPNELEILLNNLQSSIIKEYQNHNYGWSEI